MKIIWVDADNGNDTTGDGSQLTPYAGIERALEDFVSGDQVRILEGTYIPTDSIVISGMEGSIFSESPGGAVIQPEKTKKHQACVAILDSPRFTLQGFKVLQASDSSGNNIGIYCENVEKLICYTCEVSDFGVPSGACYGIFASGSLGRVERCVSYNLSGSDEGVYGIKTIGIDVIDCVTYSLSGTPDCQVVKGIEGRGIQNG